MRPINADAFDSILADGEIKARKSRKYVLESAINTIRGNLANVPTIEMPEIIRCKDCYYHPACSHEQYLGLDGFCSRAERREENNDQ